MKKIVLSTVLFSLFYFLGSVVVEAGTSKNLPQVEFKKLISKYHQKPQLKFDFVKSVKSEIMGTETSEKGKLYNSKSLFRIDVDSPNRSNVIFDGKRIWVVAYPSASLGSEPAVTSEKFDSKSRQDNPLFSILRSKNLDKSVKIIDVKSEQSNKIFKLDLIPKSETFSDIYLVFDKSENIKSISYKDELSNEVKIEITKQAISEKLDPSLFVYKPAAKEVKK